MTAWLLGRANVLGEAADELLQEMVMKAVGASQIGTEGDGTPQRENPLPCLPVADGVPSGLKG